MESELKKPNYAIPAAVVIAGVFIAAGILLKNGPVDIVGGNAISQAPQTGAIGVENLDALRPITAEDHILGNPDALVKVIEYSDFECPFCKVFQQTMNRIMSEYGKDGKVAWVYRHFPLYQIHTKARKEAAASECANELGGPNAFWKFADRFFELTPSNDNTDIATVLPQIAQELGLDESTFASCLGSGKYDKHIEDNYQNAIAIGGTGTPWSIVVAPNGKKYSLAGGQPYSAVKALIDIALQQK
jgi:protein-disulfide isomerase